jgi:formate/nitrite transporter
MASSPTFQRTSLLLEPSLAAEQMVKTGYVKSHLPPYKMAILAFLAGIYVAFGGQTMYSVLTAGGSDEAVALSTSFNPLSGLMKYVGGFAFAVALVLIVVCGAELFTGNCLILMAVLAKRVTLGEMLFDWMIVYTFNFLGAIFMTAIIYGGGVNGYYSSVSIFDTDHQNFTLTRTGKIACYFAKSKAGLEPHEMFFRAIPANMLVCLAVLCGSAAKSVEGKFFVLIFPIMAFVACGFEHSIANMFVFTMGTLLNCETKNHGYYWLNMVLVTLGNIIGASILSVGYWVSYVMPHEEVGVGLNHKELILPENSFDMSLPQNSKGEMDCKQQDYAQKQQQQQVPPSNILSEPTTTQAGSPTPPNSETTNIPR